MRWIFSLLDKPFMDHVLLKYTRIELERESVTDDPSFQTMSTAIRSWRWSWSRSSLASLLLRRVTRTSFPTSTTSWCIMTGSSPLQTTTLTSRPNKWSTKLIRLAEMTAHSFKRYIQYRIIIFCLLQDQMKWAHMCIMNIASSGKFSSDRTISQYGTEIWGVPPRYCFLRAPCEFWAVMVLKSICFSSYESLPHPNPEEESQMRNESLGMIENLIR